MCSGLRIKVKVKRMTQLKAVHMCVEGVHSVVKAMHYTWASQVSKSDYNYLKLYIVNPGAIIKNLKHIKVAIPTPIHNQTKGKKKHMEETTNNQKW